MENTRNETITVDTKKVSFEITVPDTTSMKAKIKKGLKVAIPIVCVTGLAFAGLAMRSVVVATNHANVPLAQAQISDIDFEFDFFLPHFDVEWKYQGQGVSYDYKIHALTGSVLEVEMERR